MHNAILIYAALKVFVEAILTEAKWVRPPSDANKTIDEDLFWFCSMKRAEEVSSNMNQREIAEMLLAGVPPMSEKTIEGWLEGFYADINRYEGDMRQKYIEVTNKLLTAEIRHLYGMTIDTDLEIAYEEWQQVCDDLNWFS